MCGRFTLHTPAEELAAAFNVPQVLPIRPRYNIAPSLPVLAVCMEQDNKTRGWWPFTWGLVPQWSHDTKAGPANARAETVATLPTFRDVFRRRRCLVVADGFYEWKATAAGKSPHHFRMKSGRPFAFAGLWDQWTLDGEMISTCCIITTTPNELVRDVHDRMPVILKSEAYDHWLDRTVTDLAKLKSLLGPYPAEEMESVAVTRFVSNARNEGPECLTPAD